MKYSVAVGTLHILLSFLEQRGLDRAELCKALELDETDTERPRRPHTYRQAANAVAHCH